MVEKISIFSSLQSLVCSVELTQQPLRCNGLSSLLASRRSVAPIPVGAKFLQAISAFSEV